MKMGGAGSDIKNIYKRLPLPNRDSRHLGSHGSADWHVKIWQGMHSKISFQIEVELIKKFSTHAKSLPFYLFDSD